MLKRRLIVLTGRRHPHEILLLAVCVLQSVAHVLGVAPPSSLSGVLPGWLVTVWFAMLLISGVIGLLGNAWPGHDMPTALRIRLSGMILAAGPAAVYAVGVFAYAGWRGSFAGGFVLAWGIACIWRAAQLYADLRQLKPLTYEQRHATPEPPGEGPT